ncbi:hypothetical protein DFH08DRAFT_802841 [Mycena albidolilacea]|uniref:Uncharacterized protein n=1 Tax=Mycena albidolilacea TaxID=1033008 RepID=A0AAD7AFG8_9AGAR|nr:hypothetical protein DFH08DRAFT_802841 [Mycena albidolilacea]
MPADRRDRRTDPTPRKQLSQGEKFALALGLENKPQIFHNCKKFLRRIADETFDFDLPLFQQESAMKNFVKKAVDGFPGYFGNSHTNSKQRLNELEHYAVSYLQKSGKLTNEPKKDSLQKKPVKSDIAPPQFPPSPLPSKVIKVERPKPKPLYRGAKITTVNTADTPKPTAPPLDTDAPKSKSTPVVLLAPMQGCPCPVNKLVSTPAPPPPSPPQATNQLSPRTSLPTLKEFLAGCLPPMHRRLSAFQEAGFTDGNDLLGVASWKEEAQRSFIRNHLAESALEVETIVAGLESLLAMQQAARSVFAAKL